MSLIKSFINVLSPAGSRARLTVLIFHRVHAEPDPLFPDEPDARRFHEMVSWVGRCFHLLAPDEAIRRLADGSLPAGAACITFDDGYADNCTVAMPVLQRLGVQAAFFIATGFLDGGRMWNDTLIETVRACHRDVLDLSELGLGRYELGSIDARRRAVAEILGCLKYRPPLERALLVDEVAKAGGAALPTDLMLTSGQVREMRQGGMIIGAHTRTHPILANLPADQVRQEVAGSKQDLEQILQEEIRLFAYPNGKPGADYRPADVDIIRALGFDAAFSTAWGVATSSVDFMQIPRFTPWEKQERGFCARLALNLLKSRLGR